MRKTIALPLHIPTLIFSSVIIILYILLTNFVFAHGGDTSKIHACIKNSILNAANVRIVDANTNCTNNETPLDWNIQGIPGQNGTNAELPLICTHCDLTFGTEIGVGNDIFRNGDYKGAILYDARLISFKDADFTDAKLALGRLQGGTFVNVNFTNADLKRAWFEVATLDNINFTNANLKNTRSFDTTIRSNITWSNTTCPDGTNSDNNGNTCEGHLTP